jgi:hypothetical protein
MAGRAGLLARWMTREKQHLNSSTWYNSILSLIDSGEGDSVVWLSVYLSFVMRLERCERQAASCELRGKRWRLNYKKMGLVMVIRYFLKNEMKLIIMTQLT